MQPRKYDFVTHLGRATQDTSRHGHYTGIRVGKNLRIFQEVIMYSVSAIRTGALVVDPVTRVASVNDQPLRLTGKEFAILELLSLRKGATLTKEMMLEHLYGGMHEPEMKIIDVFVCNLRKKVALATGGHHYIETVWGRGYMLRDPVAVPESLRYPGAGTAAQTHPFSGAA
jgi:two-component system, cell cycle response regulator CtrA